MDWLRDTFLLAGAPHATHGRAPFQVPPLLKQWLQVVQSPRLQFSFFSILSERGKMTAYLILEGVERGL